MKILIDGVPFEPSSEAGENRTKILDEIEAHLGKEGKVCTFIEVDGVPLDAKAFTRSRSGMEARLTSCGVQSLVLESLHEAQAYIIRLTNAGQSLASEFERNEIEKANNNLADFAEGMHWLVNVVLKSQMLLGIGDNELGDKAGAVKKLTEAVAGVANCLAENRTHEIAFQLRQKILPELTKFKGYLEKLLTFANQR